MTPTDPRVEHLMCVAMDCAIPTNGRTDAWEPLRRALCLYLAPPSQALGDSQPVAKLTELCRGLEIPAPTAASCTPAMLYEIGRAIAAQAKEAAKRAEPASCPECGGTLQWRCPACKIAQSRAVAEPASVQALRELLDAMASLRDTASESYPAGAWYEHQCKARAAQERLSRAESLARAAIAAHPSDQNHSG